MKTTKISDHTYKISKVGTMNVPVVIFANDKLIKNMQEDDTLKQASNMAKLPGAIKNIVVLDARRYF